MNKRIYLSPPHLGKYEQQFVAEAFASNWIAPLGPQVEAFEKEVAEYVGVRGALALSAGTAAIHLALRSLGVTAGDTVFCSSLTFIGSTYPVMYQGATPVFIDAEPNSWNMSPVALEWAFQDAEKRGKMPKAVIIVDLYGQSADMTPLLALCNQYNVPMIEDAAEALGATYKGQRCGSFGKFNIFSFNGNKIVTTSGGGMLLSDDVDAIEKARFWSTQARDQARHYQHTEMGYNYRLSNVLAAIGRGQLRIIEEHIQARRANFERYVEAFSDIDAIEFMPEMPQGRSIRWLTTLTVNPERTQVTVNRILDALTEENIEARPVWKPLHLQPIFKGCRYYSHYPDISVSDGLFTQGICLPSGSSLTAEEQQCVISCVKKCFTIS